MFLGYPKLLKPNYSAPNFIVYVAPLVSPSLEGFTSLPWKVLLLFLGRFYFSSLEGFYFSSLEGFMIQDAQVSKFTPLIEKGFEPPECLNALPPLDPSLYLFRRTSYFPG